jgi:hypothetical protein
MRSQILISGVVSSFLTFLLLVLLPSSARADVCSAPPNAIVAENCQPGNPASEWDISLNGDLTIQGFATDISVNRGQTVSFKVKTDAASYHIDIYRIGYYGGNGARKVVTIPSSAITPQTQPACMSDATTGLVDCGNWGISASWAVPADAVSGLYIGRLVRDDTGGANHMMFIVRDDAGGSDLLYQLSDTQWQAYNNYGGNSLYEGSPAGRAYKVSYNRPFTVRGNSIYFRAWLFGEEYPMIRWLEANGYNVSYSSGMDTDRFGSHLLSHKVFISSGHDEYWSGNQRANVEAARDAGIHLAFFSGNESFWKTRWENSIDASNTPYRTLVSYKETHANAKIDPQDPPTWTGTWRDPRFSPPADGGRPENALSGTIFMVNCCDEPPFSIVVPAEDGTMRFWRNTTVATQPAGGSVTLNGAQIGYEWDEDLDNGFRPAGLFRLSSTDVSVRNLLLDFGSTYGGPAPATHHLTMYKAPSGALVFGAGTVRWSWGLDGNHDQGSSTPDVRVQQATVNLFADMGSQPGSLQPGLVSATASTDTTPPASFITPPTGVVVGTPVTIAGTATDTGGVVGGVEVSVDGGPWHPASGRSAWTHTWLPTRSGNINIRSRAVDDSGNLETPSIGVTVSVAPRTCPCSIWDASTVPQTPSASDTSPVEVGVKFRSSVAGFITGVRFYKGPLNTGTHIGNLWTLTGTNLATATFTSESASGWQQVNFATPVAINANTTYIASYYAPVGRYSSNGLYFFRQGIDNEPLRALADGEDGANGVFLYAASSSFPTQTFNSTNYWVDVVFSTTANVPPVANNDSYTVSQGQVLGVAAPGVLANDVAQNPNPLSAIKASDPTNGGLFFNSDGSFTYTPNASFSGTDSFTYRASDGTLTSAPATVTITVNPSSGTSTTIWSPSTVPGTADANDNGSVELGVKFRANVAGSITGIRFYKGALNTGTHIGNLWSSSGTLLATATFTNETASGWQQVNFAAPVSIQANTTYVASYFAPVGQYAFNGNYFTTGVTNGPLHALANSEDPGGNGVYHYGSTSAFPLQSYNSTNYWVDVVFTSGSASPPVANNDSYTTQQGQPLTIAAPGVLTNDTAPSGNPLSASKITDPANGTLTLNTNGSLTYTPNAGFTGTDSFTYRANDGVLNSNTATVSITVTASGGGSPVTIWNPSTVPGTVNVTDTGAVELGLKFRSSVSGFVTGVRFYKGSLNTGIHIGNLWSSGGTLLATATFVNETASGWQQVNFASPVAVTANTTYVVSYFAPGGRYAFDQSYFATTGVTNGPLYALANNEDTGGNGVFTYGSSSFPSHTFNAANYWVDVVFTQ